jgi:hypothetical protein
MTDVVVRAGSPRPIGNRPVPGNFLRAENVLQLSNACRP